MSTELNLKELERKAWRSMFQDGLWDIYLGLLLALMGINAGMNELGLTEGQSIPLYLGSLVLAMIGLWLGKRFITVPRMGRATFSERRKRRISGVRAALVGSVILGLVLFLMSVAAFRTGGGLMEAMFIIPVIWALNALLVFGIGGYLLDYSRLYIIGVLYAVPVPLDLFLKTQYDIAIAPLLFGIPGLIAMGMGAVFLVRFLRDHKVITPGEPTHGS